MRTRPRFLRAVQSRVIGAMPCHLVNRSWNPAATGANAEGFCLFGCFGELRR
jgi:hypothetical protein